MNSFQQAVLTRETSEASSKVQKGDNPACILVVDDESDLEILFRQMFRREIRKKELSFTFVHNGQQALDKLDDDPHFDMVLSDIRMPQMDGLTLLSKLNRKFPILKAVMVTAYGDMENIRKAMNGGAFDFISKPIQYQDLKATIHKTLDHVKDLKELQQARDDKEKAQARLVEELTELDRMKDEFLANTSHELRTPLNGIIGIVESLIDGATGKLQDNTLQNLDLVLQSGRRLAHLVNDILDFAKLKNDNLIINPSEVSLRPLVEMVFQLSLPMARGKGLELINNIPEDLPVISGDEDRLQQILLNLIGNAVKFTEVGSVTAEAQVENHFVVISIKDTGIGIPVEKQSQIFEAFSQAEGHSIRSFDGTGLGLSITRKLVNLHNGSVGVKSRQGEGSTFTFTIPLSGEMPDQTSEPPKQAPVSLVAEDEPKAEILEKPAQVAISSVKSHGHHLVSLPRRREKHRIMVVDDNPINIQVLVNHLQDYQVTTAANGQQALDYLFDERSGFDLILLDVMMPGLSGYEVCRKIRERFLPNDLPVLLLTAKNQVKDLIVGLESGANDYISKPFAMKELMARVKTHLELGDLTREFKEAQELALEHARVAGKAEFATSVLHNVGNILSSIKVSCTQMTMKLNQSKISGFFMAGQMLEENISDLSRYLTEDSKGKKLPEYFVKLSGILKKENDMISKELESMRKRIFLMEDTIETQQFYAKDSNDIKHVILENLVEESLAVQSELLRKYRIEVHKSYRYEGSVAAHQSVLIQILVNVIKNAIEAMNKSDERNLIIEIDREINGQIFCKITDTGEGIKDLDRLFTHGYSTKEDGHGFGLHYCLRAMENMNGKLTAESEGPTKGATFILRFPANSNE